MDAGVPDLCESQRYMGQFTGGKGSWAGHLSGSKSRRHFEKRANKINHASLFKRFVEINTIYKTRRGTSNTPDTSNATDPHNQKEKNSPLGPISP